MDPKQFNQEGKNESPLPPKDGLEAAAERHDASGQSEQLRQSLARIEAAAETRRQEGRSSALAEAAARRRAEGSVEDTQVLDRSWLEALKRPWKQEKTTPYAVADEDNDLTRRMEAIRPEISPAAEDTLFSRSADDIHADLAEPETPVYDEMPADEPLLEEIPLSEEVTEEASTSPDEDLTDEHGAYDEIEDDLPPVPTTGQFYEGLLALANDLRDGKSPIFRENQVIIEREAHLAFLEHLLALCQDEQIYGIMPEDALVDLLSADGHDDPGDTPMRRVKERARVILGDATVQAETMLGDARALAQQLYNEAEEHISKRYKEAEADLDQLIANNKEASRNHLMDARAELTASRKQAVDILNKYMDKAEEDYQGYWERAEKTLLVSYEKSDRVFEKSVEVFEKELTMLQDDIETLKDILSELKIKTPK